MSRTFRFIARMCMSASLAALISNTLYAQESLPRAMSLSLDSIGSVPSGWKIAATNPRDTLAEWQITEDPVTHERALTITKIEDSFGGHYNLCWTPDIQFQNGTLEVSVRANSGEEDQGGGPIWRATDENNYYIARFNPLEENFRIYYVKDGARKEFANAYVEGITTGQWFTIKIEHHGDQIAGYLNDQKLIEVSDDTFSNSGGVGFWSKADAASSFSRFTYIIE